MPSHEGSEAFLRDFKRLTPEQRNRFRTALGRFIDDPWAMEVGARQWFRPGLRVKRVQGTRGLYEMTWAPDGRATFSWGDTAISGLLHVEWERCGDHGIL